MKTRLLSLFTMLLIVTMVLPAFQSNTAYAQGDGESIPLIVTEVEGYVQYIGADFIVVDGFVIYPNGSFDLTTLTVDDYVFVVGTLSEDGSVEAISLEYLDPPEDDGEESDEITIVGLVEIIGDNIVIGGWIIAPASAFNLSILTVGDLVILTGIQLNDTTVQATSLSILIFIIDDCTEDTDNDGDGDIDDDDCPEDEDEDEDDCDEDDEDDDDDEDQRGVCTNLNPVGQSLAAQFEVDEDTILEWRCEGFGYGEITRALSYAERLDLDVEDILDMRRDGMGWGNIRKELNANDDEEAVTLRNGRGNNGNGNGNGNGRGNKKNKNKSKNKKK